MRAVIMGMRLALIAAVILSVTGIKVPVDKTDENNTQAKSDEGAEFSKKPIYYESEDGQEDSYLAPQNPLEDISGEIATLATYLLPPSEDEQQDYYKPTEAGEQTDWYPIAPAVSSLSRQLVPPRQTEIQPVITEVSETEPTYDIFRTGKLLDARDRGVPIPSRDLQPPIENAPNEYAASLSEKTINAPLQNNRLVRPAGHPVRVWDGFVRAGPNNNLPNPLAQIPYITKKHKNPTKLYPKKYAGAFKPVPIPINQFKEEIKQLKGKQNVGDEYGTPSEDKTVLKFEDAQKKRDSKRNPENIQVEESVSESNEDDAPLEPNTSASHYRRPLSTRQAYPAPLRQAPKSAPKNEAQKHAPPADGDRTEFRMHGMKGPHSYQFGFDTGKGKNRQFRYEERDNDGRVKGHYGYMDKSGKLRVVNYDADPVHGFRADPPVEAE